MPCKTYRNRSSQFHVQSNKDTSPLKPTDTRPPLPSTPNQPYTSPWSAYTPINETQDTSPWSAPQSTRHKTQARQVHLLPINETQDTSPSSPSTPNQRDTRHKPVKSIYSQSTRHKIQARQVHLLPINETQDTSPSSPSTFNQRDTRYKPVKSIYSQSTRHKIQARQVHLLPINETQDTSPSSPSTPNQRDTRHKPVKSIYSQSTQASPMHPSKPIRPAQPSNIHPRQTHTSLLLPSRPNNNCSIPRVPEPSSPGSVITAVGRMVSAPPTASHRPRVQLMRRLPFLPGWTCFSWSR